MRALHRCSARIAVVAILLLDFSASAVFSADAEDDRPMIIERQMALQNVAVLYRRSDRFDQRENVPPARQLPNGGWLIPKKEPEIYCASFGTFVAGQCIPDGVLMLYAKATGSESFMPSPTAVKKRLLRPKPWKGASNGNGDRRHWSI